MSKDYFSNYGKPWSKKENQFMKKHYKRLGAIKTGDELGRTSGAVRSQAKLLGVTKPQRTKQQIEVDIMFDNGYAAEELSKATGISVTTLKEWRK